MMRNCVLERWDKLCDASLLRLSCTYAVKLDQLLSITSKGLTPQEDSAQSLVLTPGSRLSCSKAARVFSRLRVDFTYDGHYEEIKAQQHVQMFQWPPEATEDSVAEAACHYLQSTYMPEDVVVIAVQSVIWMGHEWPEAKVKVKETSRTDYVMVYRGLAPEMVDLLIDKQRLCTELKALVSKQETQLQTLEDDLQESQDKSGQARSFLLRCRSVPYKLAALNQTISSSKAYNLLSCRLQSAEGVLLIAVLCQNL